MAGLCLLTSVRAINSINPQKSQILTVVNMRHDCVEGMKLLLLEDRITDSDWLAGL